MILKIKRTAQDLDWWFLDGIKKVSVSKPKIKKLNKEMYENVVIFDIKSTCTCKDEQEGCSECVPYRTLICRLDNDEEYSISFDTYVYILNDNGKTIEKIVANFCD